MVAGWIHSTDIEGTEVVALWALREQPVDGLNGLCAELQKDDKPFVQGSPALSKNAALPIAY